MKQSLPKIDHQIGVGHLEVSEKAKQYVMEALDNNRLSYGPFLSRFEREFAAAHQVKYAVTCNSGTSALRVAIACLKEAHGWKDGDEVLVPAITFVATSNVLIQQNLKPVFVDVEPDYYGMDPAKIEEKITDRTRAIMPVHLFGLPCDMDPIMKIAKEHDLRVVEDSCETMFARYKGKSVGSFGDINAFSTYVAHILVTGVGGIAVTENPKYAVIVKSLVNHGRDSIYLSIDDDKGKKGKDLFNLVGRRFRFERLGYSFRLTEMEGALGCAQLEEAEDMLRKRKENAQFFLKELAPFEGSIQLPKIRPGCDHSFMMFPIVIKDKSIKKADLVNFLEENNIETRDMLPLINQPAYIKLFGKLEGQYPIAKWINNYGFYIGSHHGLTQGEKEYIVAKFREFFRARSQSK